MAMRLKPVDVVAIGVGWTGAILAKELTKAGLGIVGLERGGWRDTLDWQVPQVHDQLRYQRRYELFQDLSRSTVTFRNNTNEIARPQRWHGPFPWGEGVGGAGGHWGASTWRHTIWDFQVRSRTIARYGERAIPPDCTMQDWPLSYQELEPYYDKWEYDIGLAGKAGNLMGRIQSGGNPFEAPRSRAYPMPPHPPSYAQILFKKAVDELGYHPFPQPAATMTEPYTNPDGVSLGVCVYCGNCSSFGCEVGAKASPTTTVLPTALASGKFELRTHAAVTRINLDSTGRRAVSVTYIDGQGREFEQPADIILLTAFTWGNVQLLLVSGIGKPYDPASGMGVVGKNYSWHGNTAVTLLFYDDPKTTFNRFMGAGGLGTVIADFQGDNFDHSSLGFIGGGLVGCAQGGNGPLTSQPVPPGTPSWGSAWKAAVAHYFNRSIALTSLHDHQSYRGNYLDLDPNYRDIYGLPLLRVTFDHMPNEHRASAYIAGIHDKIAKAMSPSRYVITKLPQHFDSGAGYGIVHQVGGAITGASPADSVVNKYQQSWDVPNLFVIGASAFPQIPAFNPTGHVGAMAYYTADAINNQYVKKPGPLI
jgi:gluconate 2-dehydrogenase alpha chain